MSKKTDAAIRRAIKRISAILGIDIHEHENELWGVLRDLIKSTPDHDYFSRCPVPTCRSSNIEATEGHVIFGDIATQEWECLDCGARWETEYHAVKIRWIKKGE